MVSEIKSLALSFMENKKVLKRYNKNKSNHLSLNFAEL